MREKETYLCHSKNEEYVLGNGCREDFFNNCNIDSDVQDTFKSDYNNLEECGVVEDYNSISDFCLKDYCNHNRMRSCISKVINISPNEPIGPAHKAINITFIQRTTPAPTTSIPTTSIPTIQSPNNPIDNDGSQNGNDDKDSQSNASTNSKILSMLFFGNFVFAYFM
uniref:Uncharacterized protein n=1 Tax=Panagrolaimus superbus TaxID=310955 RepID=A0A914Z7R1_9BILA